MSAIRNPYQSYRQTQVETADQGTLLVMLYNGAIRFLAEARQAMAAEDLEETNRLLGRVQDILCELMGSLNPELPDISGRLFQLYEYMHHQLVQANIKKDPALIDEVDKMLKQLLEAWQVAIDEGKTANENDEDDNSGSKDLTGKEYKA
ncbi:MAG: flagellar export chaperone FliS [Bacillota bacterium]